MEIRDDPYFKQYIRSRNVRENSIKSYEYAIKKYCEFLNKTPIELIKEAWKDQIRESWISDRRINNYFLDFHDSLQDMSHNSKKSSIGFIRAFYNNFEIQLPRMKIKKEIINKN